jgi:hypothetical protein
VPPNGGSVCIETDRFEALEREQATLTISTARLERRVTEEFLGVFAAISRVETKVDRLLEGVEIGGVRRAPMPSLDWELDETTMHGREDPATAASLWALRAREAAEKADKLQAELNLARTTAAAATSRYEERARHSERVADLSIARWKLIAGLVATVLTSGAVTALIAQMLGG